MSDGAVSTLDVLRLAEAAGHPDESCTELLPTGSIRSFRVGDVVVRIDQDPQGRGLVHEARALRAFATALAPLRTPPVLLDGGGGEGASAHVVYPFLPGHTLARDEVAAHVDEIADVFAAVHGAALFDLVQRLPRIKGRTLLEEYKTVSQQVRAWLLERERDGLGQDLLTLTMSDLSRALRNFAIAQDHVFRLTARPVVLHGHPRVSVFIADEGAPLSLVLWHKTAVGDPAIDLARFAVDADLSEDDEDRLLRRYLDGLIAQGRREPNFLARFFARKYIEFLARPVRELSRLRALKQSPEVMSVGDPLAEIEARTERVRGQVVAAVNHLAGFTGGGRPVTLDEVRAMGQPVATEELYLRGRTFHIAITGLAYVGKTQVGASVAQRLQHHYVNTSVVARACALLEQSLDDDTRSGPQLVAALFDHDFVLEPDKDPPYYRATLDGRDITLGIHSDIDQVRAGQLLDDPAFRKALANEIGTRFAAAGVVIEGAHAADLLSVRARRFHLHCDDEVRLSRLISHRHDLDEPSARRLLSDLDAAMKDDTRDRTVIDIGELPAPGAALAILRQLLPASRRRALTAPDLSGRAPLFDG